MLLTRKKREIRTLASLFIKALVILYNLFLFFFLSVYSSVCYSNFKSEVILAM